MTSPHRPKRREEKEPPPPKPGSPNEQFKKHSKEEAERDYSPQKGSKKV